MELWLRNLDTGEVGGEQVRDWMKERGTLSDGSSISYGFGLAHYDYRDTPIIGHGGSDLGFLSYVARAPEDGFGIVVLANRSDISPSRLAFGILDRLLDKPPAKSKATGATEPSVAQKRIADAEKLRIEIGGDELAPYEGLFYLEDETAITTFFHNGKLRQIESGRVNSLIPIGNHVFVDSRSGTEIAFGTPADGAAPSLIRKNADGESVAGKRIPREEWEGYVGALAGRYYSPELGRTYQIVRHPQREWPRIIMPRFGGFALWRVSGNRFRTEEGCPIQFIEFERDALGTITGFRASNKRALNVLFEKE